MSGVDVIRVAALNAVPHGFLGRRGGVSTGELAGLNVGFGSQDDRDAIDENRRRAIEAVAPGAALATVHQVHSGDAVYVEAPWPQAERPHADAMVTDRPGILLGIPRDLASQLIIQSAVGAATMLAEGSSHPVILREAVTSPAGTTIMAIRELEKHGVRAALLAAIESARDRSVELGRQHED